MAVMRLMIRDGRREVWERNAMVAYVDPDTSELFVVGQGNTGEMIGRDHEILPALERLRVGRN